MAGQAAPALTLVGWYLVRPPLLHFNSHHSHSDTAATLSRWTVVRTFATQKECETQRGGNPWKLCVAATTRALFRPRLRGSGD
jgi:hypothetical protein